MSEWSPWFRLVISVLATWRIAHLIACEDGPFDIIVTLRSRAGNGQIGHLMDCPYCLTIWIAIPFAFILGSNLAGCAAAWLAVSGGASLCERFSALSDAKPLSVNTPPRGE